MKADAGTAWIAMRMPGPGRLLRMGRMPRRFSLPISDLGSRREAKT